MTDEQRLARIEQRLVEMQTTIDVLTTRNEKMDRALAAAGMVNPNEVRQMFDDLKTVRVVVLGDKHLGIEPLRPMVVGLQQSIDRAKWIAGSLATSNVGTIAAWISTLLK